jgi:hypothetical protein
LEQRRWSIDCADAYSIANVRRAVMDELQTIVDQGADLFTFETVLGELLACEMGRGHLAMAVTVERGVGGPTVNLYTQGRAGITSTQGELRNAILKAARVPMSVEISPQATHICLRVPMPHERQLQRSGQGTGLTLK